VVRSRRERCDTGGEPTRALRTRRSNSAATATAARAFNRGTDARECSWLVRECVFDLDPRGTQADRAALVAIILHIHPTADVNLRMLLDPTFDNVRWGTTAADPEPRWILIDP
jgi:hypothetical protein